MLDLTPEKLLVVGLIAIMVLGPNRLPQAARSLGRMLNTLRRMSSDFQDEVKSALAEPTQVLHEAVGDWRPTDVRTKLRGVVQDTIGVPPLRSLPGPASSGAQGGFPPTTPLPTAGKDGGPPVPDDPSFN